MAESKQGQAMPSVASKLSIKQKVQVSWENLT
jgi:hypothetical protein